MTQQNTLQGEAAQGLIVKALGGFYYVQAGQQLLECPGPEDCSARRISRPWWGIR